ncbi:IclR family transcriptional regulator [Pollutimonas harenae]|uniref:IclR family transcriptional regulator n=1 Tax=Pollutimonas harenae TaxID=657015 RepID=A0A853GUQ4_9BURK|nr:IclR family transcriptional regulator [Pollutimonas harenae]NYT84516.1 IclR family transcriptional regulator [Pollutimonas harenae]TEA73090.1 IclR family transcriptional regulator [Pollutimonas harenae]
MIATPSISPPPKPTQRIRPVPAVTRAIAILRLLGKTKEPMNVKSISDALDLVPSTCLHILRALTAEKLLAFDSASKRYRLGTGMLVLARSVMETNSFAQVVQPALDLVSEKWGVTAIGVEVDLHHMVVTALSRSKLPFRLHVDVGSRFPGLISATGRLVAAYGHYSRQEIDQQFASLRWHKPISLASWHKEVETAKENGYSLDSDGYIAGITLIAVPVLNARQHITHTIVAASISHQMSQNETDALIQELKSHARRTSEQLYSGDDTP